MITYIDDVRMLKHSFVFIEIILDRFSFIFTKKFPLPPPPPTSHLVELCLLYLKLKRVLAGRQVRIAAANRLKKFRKNC